MIRHRVFFLPKGVKYATMGSLSKGRDRMKTYRIYLIRHGLIEGNL